MSAKLVNVSDTEVKMEVTVELGHSMLRTDRRGDSSESE